MHNPEGMWYCTRCDSDYCLVHGTEHSKNPKGYLKRYKPKPKLIIVPKPDPRKELMFKYKSHINKLPIQRLT